MPYEARAKLAQNVMAKACLELMARKKTNLSVAADVDTAEEMLDLAEKVCTSGCTAIAPRVRKRCVFELYGSEERNKQSVASL